MKNLLLYAAMFLVTSVSFSQLSVKPNGATSSYIYVDGTNAIDFFVTDDVHLEKNAAGTTEASIYLRNGAQLLQGTGTTANTGDGLLSVYQTVPETSFYHYTFWNSPVSITSGSGNLNAGLSRLYDCTPCGATTTAATATRTTPRHNGYYGPPISISTRWIYKRVSSAPGDSEARYVRVGASDAIEPHHGFLMKGIGNTVQAQTYDFRGRPNKGDIDVPILAANTAQWVLTGNPYPSAIDLQLVFQDNNTGDGGLENDAGLSQFNFWDEPKDSEYSHYYTDKSGGWGVYAPVANVYTAAPFFNYDASGPGTPAGTGSAVYLRRYAPIGQGFLAVTDGSGAAGVTTLWLRNSQRVNHKQVANEFRRPENTNNKNVLPKEKSPSDNIGLRINANLGDNMVRQLYLAFDEKTTKGFDRGWDAISPMEEIDPLDAFLPILNENDEELKLVIQGLPFDFNGPTKFMIPITFKLNERMKIKVKAIEEINFEYTAYLYDALKDRAKQMSGGKTARYNLNAGTHKDRFYIVIIPGRNARASEVSTEDFKIIEDLNDNFEDNLAYFQNNAVAQLELINPKEYNISQVNLYDTAGKLVISKDNLGNDTQLSIPTHSLSDGIYLANVITTDNFITDFKILVINKK